MSAEKKRLAISHQPSALERMIARHTSTCSVNTYSDAQYCSCGRDKAAVELERLQARDAEAREIITHMLAYAGQGIPLAMERERAQKWLEMK